ncbi:MAG TPA: GMC family oxidoreductase [Streptosporangiaceae bacterium]|jgi:choline dehydrogenase-like flavoprotein|nr:GMC family oxidoreductase [Streptosporangiaceae bacterium]
MTDRYDVIIIGTGAGGGTVAHTLAPTGKKILLLERGDYLPRELGNWDPDAVFVDGRYISKDTWYDEHGKAFQPQVHYFVGGATKLYGAALYRLRPADFGEIKYSDGVSPAWPLDYGELEPYYTRAEWLYQVHGDHGEDPTEGPASKQYPWPAISHEPRIQQISDQLAKEGYHPFHAPSGVLLDEANRPASACIRCAWSDGYPCLVHAKSDAEVIAVRPALDQPNVTMLTNSEVIRLVADSSGGAIAEVVVRRDGQEEHYAADIVVLAAGAVNTAKILLASATGAHPDGLANGSGQVGRNFMFHNSKAVAALATEPNDTVYQKTLGINDFYLATGERAPLGNIQMLGKSNAGAMKGEEPKLTKLVPRRALDEVARHSIDFWLSTEDLPRPGNRVTLDSAGKLHLAYTFTNAAETAALYKELETILNKTGLTARNVFRKNFYMDMEVPIAGVAHQAGTCRFGSDRSLSVADVSCKAHELDNLYLADASVFPSIGAVNPALTVMANAIRVGDLIAERLR